MANTVFIAKNNIVDSEISTFYKSFIQGKALMNATTIDNQIKEELGWDVYSPYYQDVFDLETGVQLYVGDKTVKSKPKHQHVGMSKIYNALLKALERLTAIVKKAGGYPNEDLKQATKAI